jgi:flavin reductase (DIM6/NTAB) family NADH-FMN oxidoreductase RutF
MPTLTPSLFRRACAQFATGIVIATAFDGRPCGLTINSFTSVSLRPPLILFLIDHEANIIELFRRRANFAINILSAGQQELASSFAYGTGDRFEGVAWRPGLQSVPLIEGALATLECRVVRITPAGDHDIFLGEVLAANVAEGEPLVYFAGRYARLVKPETSL